jgi:predicted PurR-regulated permease PerM
LAFDQGTFVDSLAKTAKHYGALAEDDTPRPYDPSEWSTPSQVAICGIFLILFIAALDLARPVLLPATFAFVIGMMLGPVSNRAKALGIPPLLTAIVLWLMVIAVVYGVIALLASPAIDWIGKAPEIGQSIKEKFQFLNRPLQSLQDLRNAILPENEKTHLGVDIVNFVQPAFGVVTPAIGQSFIFFGTLFFVLLGRARLRAAVITRFDDHEERLRALKIMNDMEHSLTSYLSVVAIINFAVGLAAMIIAFAAGLPSPLAWGVLAFILNFIPYIGALIMEVVLLAVGLVTFPTLTHALVAPVLYFAFTTLEGHFITPAIMGRRLTLIPLAVFLSLIFWTWLWGPAGAFLAVPLLIVAMVSIQHIFPRQQSILPG